MRDGKGELDKNFENDFPFVRLSLTLTILVIFTKHHSKKTSPKAKFLEVNEKKETIQLPVSLIAQS